MKHSTTRNEVPSDQERLMQICYSVDKGFVQPTPTEDLEVRTPRVVTAAAQVRPINWCAVAGSASTMGLPLYLKKTLTTRCTSVYLIRAGNRNLRYNLFELQVSSRNYNGILRCWQEAFAWVGWLKKKGFFENLSSLPSQLFTIFSNFLALLLSPPDLLLCFHLHSLSF
jgi:hypothetical protein